MTRKNLEVILLAVVLLLISPIYTLAANFSFYPSNGTVKSTSRIFTVDILIDSEGADITSARFAIKFNPTQVRVVKASKNNTLFNLWPEDESTIDNSRGMLMLTGFTQSGTEKSLYKTVSNPDVIARVEFEVITESKDDVVLSFEYSGSNELFKSSIMQEGSPPQNVLLVKPEDAVFSLGRFKSPQTAIEPTYIGVIVGLVLIGVGIFIVNSKISLFERRRGTIVYHD